MTNAPVPPAWRAAHQEALRAMLRVEARTLARLRAVVALVVRQHRKNPDPRAGARAAAVALGAVVAEVLYQGRRQARSAAHEALRREVALAREFGAGALPEPPFVDGPDASSQSRARASGEAYARAWLKTALEEIDATEASSRSRDGKARQ